MRGMVVGILSTLALAHCLSSALAGNAAPAASAGAAEAADVADAADVQRELLHRISELEQRVTELSEASSRPFSAAFRAFFAEIAGRGNQTSKLRSADRLEDPFNEMEHVADAYGHVLTGKAGCVLGIFLVLQWHLRFHFGDLLHKKLYWRLGLLPYEAKPWMRWRRLGVNIVIVYIFYGNTPAFVQERPFSYSFVVVFLDTVVFYYWFMFLGSLISPDCKRDDLKKWINPVDENDDDGRCPEKWQADNIYEDLTIDFFRVLSIWTAQIGLIFFYIAGLSFDTYSDEKSATAKFGCWIAAVCFQLGAGDQQLGAAYNAKFWRHILLHPSGAQMDSTKTGEPLLHKDDRLKNALQEMQLPPRQVEKLLQRVITDEDVKILEEISNKDISDCNKDPLASATDTFFKRMNIALDDDFQRILGLEQSLEYVGSLCKVCSFYNMKFKFEWTIRAFMDLTVNSMARNVILYTVPIMVIVDRPLDFVKDLTAVMFITMIDNIDGNPKDLAEILVKVKHSIHHANKRAAYSCRNRFRKAMGYDVEVEPQEVCLNMFEKNFIQGHKECFYKLDFVASDEWMEFRLKGIPMTEEELDATDQEPEGNCQL